MTANRRSDGDEFEYRLLLYLTSLTGETFLYVKKIKNGIWICKTAKNTWVLKEFPTKEKIENQIYLTKLLFTNGFHWTYRFHPIHAKKICFFEDRIFGLIEFIKKGSSFSYQTKNNRIQAIKLLSKFHETTQLFANEFSTRLSFFNQIEKWETRLKDFISNIPQLKKFIPQYYMEVYVEWAKWSLHMLKQNKNYFKQQTRCVIHGDVAHHNFIYNFDEQLFLIDFDLIHLGSPVIDYLQFTNRILPYIEWSNHELQQMETIKDLLNHKAFVIALIYPTDVLREWNRFIRSKNKKNKDQSLAYLKEITFNQYVQRKTFVNEMIKRI